MSEFRSFAERIALQEYVKKVYREGPVCAISEENIGKYIEVNAPEVSSSSRREMAEAVYNDLCNYY